MGGRITALRVQKRNPRRVNVYIEDQFAFGLATIEAMRLKIGQHLTDTEITQLKDKDQSEIAYDRVLNLLSYRPRSIAEVRRRLAEKKFDESNIDEAVSRLIRAGLLDDEAFARYWLENRDTFKPRSSRALRYELRQKGVIDSVIDTVLTDHNDSDAAYRAAFSKAQKLTRQHDIDTCRPKLLAFLNRRGFSYGIARETVDKLLAELGDAGVEK